MARIVFLAVLEYLSSNGQPLYCDAAVVCKQGEQSCHVHPIEQCPGSYDPKKDELKGKWNMGQCLTSEVRIGNEAWHTLGCSPDRFELDVDSSIARSAKP